MIFNMAVVVAVYLFARTQKVVRKQILGKTIFLFAMLSTVMLFSLNNQIGLIEGLCLLIFFFGFVFYNIRQEFRNKTAPDSCPCPVPDNSGFIANGECVCGVSIRQIIFLFVLGQAMLIFGAYLLVSFGEKIAHTMNIAEGTVGVIFIAIGTGLPDLFTAIASIKKKHNGIALGNIIGSCILNCTLLLGSSSVMSGFHGGLPISNWILYLSLPIMIISTIIAILPIIVTQKTKRHFGIVLIAIYIAYLCLLCF
jgi:cation:H+ antiporter